jgi:two-component system, OmpR family, response regulator
VSKAFATGASSAKGSNRMSACSSPPATDSAAFLTKGSHPVEQRPQRGSAGVKLDRAAARRAPPSLEVHGALRATSRLAQLARATNDNGFAAFMSCGPGVPDDRDLPIRILVIGDDSALRHMVVDYLEEHTMRVVSIAEQEDVTRQLAREKPDLVVLDLQLGQAGRLDPLRVIRSQSDVPLIVTTDRRIDEADRVIALELGADDCITKPLGLRELLARIRAILRRSKARRSESVRSPGPRYCRFGGWQLDRRNRSLTSPDGGAVVLTKGEYALLLAFLDAPMRTLSREHLLRATRMHEDVLDRSVDVKILRLRRKLERDPASPRMIQAQRGIGYMFALPVVCA